VTLSRTRSPGDLEEVASVRKMLDGRYADLKSSGVAAIDGEKALMKLRERANAGERDRSGVWRCECRGPSA